MKNLQFFPFERNQYYHGKLMTYQDFTSEQKYMNDKRRLINRFLHGAGVAAGLNVVRLDDRTLSVEAGLALDESGREIVLEQPTVLMLDQIEGYEELAGAEDVTSVFLCLGYREEGVSPARDAEQSGRGGMVYERCREDRRLYLTTAPREENWDTIESLMRQKTLLFENQDLRITRSIPAFVSSGASFSSVLGIEAKRAIDEVSVTAVSSLACLVSGGTDRMEEKWSGSFREAGDCREISTPLEAYALESGTGEISLRKRQMTIMIDGRAFHPAADETQQIGISSRDIRTQMLDYWYRNQMNHVLAMSGTGGIYLARIILEPSGSGYAISRVEPLPFGQRVYHPLLNMGLIESLSEETEALRKAGQAKQGSLPDAAGAQEPGELATGVCTISLGIGGKEGEKFFSGEIVHGLGLGRLQIDLSLEMGEYQYFGSAEIFDDMKLRAELSAKANVERGSFVIGIRLLEASVLENVHVRWVARRLPEEREAGMGQHIRILPDKPELRVMQSRYFRAETENLAGATILWEVCSPGGGKITRDGRYTAPDTEGIYEIRAFCQEDPKIRNSIFVIVRE